MEEKIKPSFEVSMKYLSLSRWQLSNNIEVEVGFGLFQEKQAALNYADKQHSDLFEMDNSFMLILECGELISQEDLTIQLYEVKKASKDKVFLTENDYFEIQINLEALKKKIHFFNTPIPLSYNAKQAT